MIILDGNYIEVIRVNEARGIQPFSGRGDETIYLIEEDCQQLLGDFVPLALDTVHPDRPGFYLVADGLNPQMVGGTVRQWTRTWAKIPQQRIEGSSIGWSIPGLARGGTNPIINIAALSAPADFLITITTETAHGLLVSDRVYFYYQATVSIYKPEGFWACEIISIPSVNTIKVRATGAGAFFDNAIAIQKAAPCREPRNTAVNCDIVYDYFLPGVTPDVPDKDSIPLLNPPEVRDVLEALIDPPIYSSISNPTNTDYLMQIAAGSKIVAEQSTLTRWQGNIYERITRKVTAQ